MENIHRVTTHLRTKVTGKVDASRRVLNLVPSLDGNAFHIDQAGNYWRAYLFIERARTYEAVQTPRQAFETAKAFGNFQKLLADLPAPRLHDTVPDFHHTPRRFAALEQAIKGDCASRVRLAGPEIEFALSCKRLTWALLEAELPERITHNDTKLNNVMLDDKTGEGICVIDLDTVMPGLAVYDFGDMVRTTVSPAHEDERDLSKVKVRFPMFEALVRGYVASGSGFLNKSEKSCLPIAGQVITFEIGIRFLTDFLQGDVYFKTHREGHNLDRCRAQFQLVRSVEKHMPRMRELVAGLSRHH
jgi:Ser/Thr protein kinase RdoA (MazF antagonist)